MMLHHTHTLSDTFQLNKKLLQTLDFIKIPEFMCVEVYARFSSAFAQSSNFPFIKFKYTNTHIIRTIYNNIRS